MSGCDCSFEANNRDQRRVLKILLAINATMFVNTVARAPLHRQALHLV